MPAAVPRCDFSKKLLSYVGVIGNRLTTRARQLGSKNGLFPSFIACKLMGPFRSGPLSTSLALRRGNYPSEYDLRRQL